MAAATEQKTSSDTPKAPVNLPPRYASFDIGVEKKSDSVPSSKSRFTAFATNAVVTKTPRALMISISCMMTNGAFLLTFPIAPPIRTESVVIARRVSRKKIPIEM